MILGVILDPIRDELFTVEKNKGAFLNNRKIQVSNEIQMNKCLIGTGFPFKLKEHLSTYLNCFHDIFEQCSGARRIGSAALDLAYIASGRFDGFWELGLSPWDMAAGTLMIAEAGGQISDFWGGDSYLESGYIVASNGHIHQNMIQMTTKHFPK
jgi:myo-inositol-1(or 4)-monophosphatase